MILFANIGATGFPTCPRIRLLCAASDLPEPNFQALLRELFVLLDNNRAANSDWLIDSLPIIGAAGNRSSTARVAREMAAKGFCAAKKVYFHGVRQHCAARRGCLPLLPRLVWLRAASVHDLTAIRWQELTVFHGATIFADKA